MSIRVLHVNTERGWRGGERQTLWLAGALARRGDVSVVAARAGEPLADRAAQAGLEVVDCSPANEIDVIAAWKLRRVIRRRDIQIVHAHTAHAAAIATFAILGTKARLVVARRVDFRLRNNLGTRLKYARADLFVAVSHAVARVLEESGIVPSRVVVVPDGVDVHRVVTRADTGRLRGLGVTDGPLVVQVSALVGHKDPLNFVRAIAYARRTLPNIQALLVGEGPLRADVDREVEQLELENTLHVLGFRTDADALLAAADVACLSSREEGMGSVLLDALAFGLPVAATLAGGIPEVIEDGACGLLAPIGDPAALGSAIVRLVTDTALAARCRARAPSRAAEFSVERMADRTVDVYDRVLRS